MGFEPMISGMKILRPRRTERRCCLKYLVYSHFLSSVSWKPSDLAKCGNFEESNKTMNKIEVTLPHKSLWDRSKSHRLSLSRDSTMEQSV